MNRTILSILACCIAAVALIGCGGGGGPEAVFNTWAAAMKAGDMAGAMACNPPEAQKAQAIQMATGMLTLADTKGEEAAAELKKALGAAKVKTDAEGDARFADVTDYPAVFKASYDWMQKHMPEQKTEVKKGDATIKDVKITDKTATGTAVLTTEGKEKPDEMTVTFTQIEGKWYIVSMAPKAAE